MTKGLGILLLVFGLAAVTSGGLLTRHALTRYGGPSAPKGICWHPRDWRLAWNTRDWYTEPRGHAFSWAGRVLMMLGFVAMFVVFAFGP